MAALFDVNGHLHSSLYSPLIIRYSNIFKLQAFRKASLIVRYL